MVFTTLWQRDPDPVFPRLESDERVDVAVVGGGYAGLSAARHLKQADPSLDIALLERERIGFGASGRNAGILSPFLPISWLIDCTGSPRRLEEVRFAAEFIYSETQAFSELIQEEGIDCDFHPVEIVTTGTDWKREKFLALLGERILLTRIPGRLSESARGGYTLDGASLNPLALAQGLARQARRLGVGIYEKTRITGIHRAPSGIDLVSEGGRRVRAKKAVLATNAYTHDIALERATKLPDPIHTYLLATAELDPISLRRLDLGNRTIVDIGREYFYARLAGNRLLFGGFDRVDRTTEPSPKADEVYYRRLEAEMRRRFPFLSGIRVAAIWSGPYHEARTQVPVIRPLNHIPEVILNVGYGGVGATLTQFSGRLLAALVLGDRHHDERAARMRSVYSSTRFPVWEGAKLGIRFLCRLGSFRGLSES
jgi:gamma-glutamylputrescine oxidase